MIQANVRVFEMVSGDFHAQIAGGAVGGGVCSSSWPNSASSGWSRPPTRSLAHQARDAGRDSRELRGPRDDPWIDYPGSPPASLRGVNVVMNYTEAHTTYGGTVTVSPDVPNDAGPSGHFLLHVMAGALSQALPGNVMAQGSPNIRGIQVSGKDLLGAPSG